MKLRKLLYIAITAMIFSTTASTQAGEKTIGLRTGYNTRAHAPIAGLFFQYRFSDHFGIAPNVDYYFRYNNADALSLNVNTHFPISLTQTGKVSFYPLAGLNYTSWNYHHNQIESDDVSSRISRLGLNAGAGVEFRATPTLKLSAEAKATLIKQYSSGSFTVSIGYIF